MRTPAPPIRADVHARFRRVVLRADRAHAEYLATLRPRAADRREPGPRGAAYRRTFKPGADA